jgi:hypothetical protein
MIEHFFRSKQGQEAQSGLAINDETPVTLTEKLHCKKWIIRLLMFAMFGNFFVPSILDLLDQYASKGRYFQAETAVFSWLGVWGAEFAVVCLLGGALCSPVKYQLPISIGASFLLSTSLMMGLVLDEGNFPLPIELVLLLIVGSFVVPILGVSILFISLRMFRRSLLQLGTNTLQHFKGTGPEQVSLRYIFFAATLFALALAIARAWQDSLEFVRDPEFWQFILCGAILTVFGGVLTVLVAECILRESRFEVLAIILLSLAFAIGFIPFLYIQFLYLCGSGSNGDKFLFQTRLFLLAFSLSLMLWLLPLRLIGMRLRFVGQDEAPPTKSQG